MNHRSLRGIELQEMIESTGSERLAAILIGVLSYKSHPELWEWILHSMEEAGDGYVSILQTRTDQMTSALEELLAD